MNKLIYILNHYSDHSSSHFYHVINLLEKLADQGVKIALIIEKSESIPLVSSPDIKVYPIQRSKWIRPWILISHLFHLNKKGYKKVFVRINWRAAMIAAFAGFFTGQKTYFWLSTQGNKEYYQSLPFNLKKVIIWFKSQLPYYLLKKSIYRLVTGPESMVEYYVEKYGFKREKIELLYNDIDTHRFQPISKSQKENLRKELNLPKDNFLILFVHRFSPVRKTAYYLPYILDEFFEEQKKKAVTFLMVGGGPEQKSIANILADRPYASSVLLIQTVPNAVIDQYYKCADLFIQPTNAEGFPRVMLEAMACGLPLITTDAGGIPDLLGPKQKKYMLPKEDRKAFAQALKELSSDEAALLNCSEENRKEAQKYSTDSIASMYVKTLFNY
jgi:glycosyltransferase involved in cell wall biosynthesis